MITKNLKNEAWEPKRVSVSKRKQIDFDLKSVSIDGAHNATLVGFVIA